MGLGRLARVPIRVAPRRFPTRGDVLRFCARLRSCGQGRQPPSRTGPTGLPRPRRGLRRAPLPGVRPPQGVPAVREAALHQRPGQQDDSEHFRGPDPGGTGWPGRVLRRVPDEDQVAQRRAVRRHVGGSGCAGDSLRRCDVRRDSQTPARVQLQDCRAVRRQHLQHLLRSGGATLAVGTRPSAPGRSAAHGSTRNWRRPGGQDTSQQMGHEERGGESRSHLARSHAERRRQRQRVGQQDPGPVGGLPQLPSTRSAGLHQCQ